MRCLLDKNVIRHAIAGLYFASRRPLFRLEMDALRFWRVAEEHDVALFISHVSHHVLQRFSEYEEVQIFLNSVSVLSPTRYHVRWTRRIRETTGLTREDAAMIALASFGTDEQSSLLGTHLLITQDQAIVNAYSHHLPTLQRRFRAMTAQLRPPYCYALLPRLATPSEMVTEWESDPPSTIE